MAALRHAGKDHLAALGATMKGRSGRYWIVDRGWWVLNIEFQPSGFEVATYVNVGVQHLWHGHGFLGAFEYGYRRRVREEAGGSLDAHRSDEQVAATVEAYAAVAEATTSAYLSALENDEEHLQAILRYQGSRIVPVLWDVAMAAAILGRRRQAKMALRELDTHYQRRRDIADATESRKSAEVSELADLVNGAGSPTDWINARIAMERLAVGLPESEFPTLSASNRLRRLSRGGDPLQELDSLYAR